MNRSPFDPPGPDPARDPNRIEQVPPEVKPIHPRENEPVPPERKEINHPDPEVSPGRP